MKTRAAICAMICIFLLLITAVCFADEDTFSYRFADSEEAAELLLENRDYYENLTQNDLNFRMQKLDSTLAELEAFAADQTLDWSEKEKEAVRSAMDKIESVCRERGYSLPRTDGIIFAKTTMHEECGAGAYTHETEIFLGEILLQIGLDQDPTYQYYFQKVIAHELFHCLTRNHPDFREAMYSILGFTVVAENYDFSPEIDRIIISNPDVGHHNAYAAFDIDGEMKDCVVIFISAEPFREPGDIFFDSKMTGLVPVDDLSVMYTSEDAENFWEVFGLNTDYVIDPEETLADNFSFTIINDPDFEYNTPEIIRQIDDYLKTEKSSAG